MLRHIQKTSSVGGGTADTQRANEEHRARIFGQRNAVFVANYHCLRFQVCSLFALSSSFKLLLPVVSAFCQYLPIFFIPGVVSLFFVFVAACLLFLGISLRALVILSGAVYL